jgi:predicted O-linked N-acetylglucosamine transferase (SPINDLY family)
MAGGGEKQSDDQSATSSLPSASPNSPEALHLQAYLEYSVGDYEEAHSLLARLLKVSPTSSHFFDLGLTCWKKGDASGAADAFAKAAEAQPGSSEALYNAAIAQLWLRNRRTAYDLALAAIRLRPGLAAKWVFVLLQGLRGKARGAILEDDGWQITTREFPEVRTAIGFGFLKRGEPGEAAGEFKRAIALERTAQRHLLLGLALYGSGRATEARHQFELALELDPRSVEAEAHRAVILEEEHRHDEARAIYERFVRANPHDLFTLSRLLYIAAMEGRFADATGYSKRLNTSIGNSDLSSVDWERLTTIAYRAILWPLTVPSRRRLIRAIDAQLCELTARRNGLLRKPLEIPDRGQRRLRIGYLSSFLRDHPIGHVTADLYGAHDRKRFDVHVFHASGVHDRYSERIAAGAEHFHRLTGKVSEIAKTIRGCDLDLLIYLDGYMNHPLMQVIAMRPAPRQAFWQGHSGACDLSSIEFLIADPIVTPEDYAENFNVKIVRLPRTFHCASPHPIAASPARSKCGLPDTGFVFCAFNNPEKIEQTVFDAWMRILGRVEGSVLWLSAGPTPTFEENLKREAAARGVAEDRLIFARRVKDKSAHLARHKHCGLFLDTLVVNAATTALDALWAGVPLLTVKGNTFASRVASSLITAMGLEDVICKNIAEYEDRAVLLAQDQSALAELTRRFASARDVSPLFKVEQFCRDLEEAYEKVLHGSA